MTTTFTPERIQQLLAGVDFTDPESMTLEQRQALEASQNHGSNYIGGQNGPVVQPTLPAGAYAGQPGNNSPAVAQNNAAAQAQIAAQSPGRLQDASGSGDPYAQFKDAYEQAYGRPISQAELDDNSFLGPLAEDHVGLFRLLPADRIIGMDSQYLSKLSNDDLLPLLKQYPQALGDFSADRLSSFSNEAKNEFISNLDQIDPGNQLAADLRGAVTRSGGTPPAEPGTQPAEAPPAAPPGTTPNADNKTINQPTAGNPATTAPAAANPDPYGVNGTATLRSQYALPKLQTYGVNQSALTGLNGGPDALAIYRQIAGLTGAPAQGTSATAVPMGGLNGVNVDSPNYDSNAIYATGLKTGGTGAPSGGNGISHLSADPYGAGAAPGPYAPGNAPDATPTAPDPTAPPSPYSPGNPYAPYTDPNSPYFNSTAGASADNWEAAHGNLKADPKAAGAGPQTPGSVTIFNSPLGQEKTSAQIDQINQAIAASQAAIAASQQKLDLAQQQYELALQKNDQSNIIAQQNLVRQYQNDLATQQNQAQQLQLNAQLGYANSARADTASAIDVAGQTGFYNGAPTMAMQNLISTTDRANAQLNADRANQAAQIALKQGDQAEAQRQFNISQSFTQQIALYDRNQAARRDPASYIDKTFALRGQQSPDSGATTAPQMTIGANGAYQAPTTGAVTNGISSLQSNGATAAPPSGISTTGQGMNEQSGIYLDGGNVSGGTQNLSSATAAAANPTPLSGSELLNSPYTAPGIKSLYASSAPTDRLNAPSAQGLNGLFPSEKASLDAGLLANGQNPDDVYAQTQRLSATKAPSLSGTRTPVYR